MSVADIFADDTTLSRTCSDIQNKNASLSEDLNTVSTWCKNNYMFIAINV